MKNFSEDITPGKILIVIAIIALLIAICAYLDIRVTPFWLILIISYYFQF